jgi:predicted Abi (CAAX) family protease
MKQDRFLMGILAFIGLLVVAAVVLFFVRNEKPAYGPEDKPEGVLYNYAVALQLHDYQRAYSYLAENNNKPTYDAFYQAFLTRQLDTSTSALQIGNVQILPNGEAWVNVTIQYAGSGLFNTSWSNTDKGTLVKQNGAWKITYLPNPYWGFDWYQPTPAPAKL